MLFENPRQNLPRVVLSRRLFNLLFNYFGRASGNKEKISQDLFAFLGKGTRYPYLGHRQTMHSPNNKQAPTPRLVIWLPRRWRGLGIRFHWPHRLRSKKSNSYILTEVNASVQIHHSVACSKHKNVNHSQTDEQAYFWLIFLPKTSCFWQCQPF